MEKTGDSYIVLAKKRAGLYGVKKPQDAQKAKHLWKMKAAKEEYYDPTREENILGRNKTRLALWEEHLKDPSRGAGQNPEVCGKFVLEDLGPNAWWKECLAMECSPMAGDGFLQSLWEKPIWEGVWPYLDPMDSVCLRTASTEWNVPGKYGPHGELFFLPSD